MTQIKLRRDTYANFTSSNPILGSGEPAYETDTKKLKIGDGSTAYTQLEYFSSGGGGGSADITATLPLKIDESGVISLEVDGQTIQIVDGKLHANLDELGNEVNSIAGEVTALQADVLTKQDKLTAGDNITISADNVISSTGGSAPSNMVTTNTRQDITEYKTFIGVGFKNTDSSPKTTITISPSSAEIDLRYNGDISSANGSRIRDNSDSFFIGTNEKGTMIGSSIPIVRQGAGPYFDRYTVLDSSNVGDFVDGTTVTYSNGKLSAAGGGGGTPDNMVTTDTDQSITGAKTIDKLIIPQTLLTKGIFIEGKSSPSIYAYGGNLGFSNVGTLKLQNLSIENAPIEIGSYDNTYGQYSLRCLGSNSITGNTFSDYILSYIVSSRRTVLGNSDNITQISGSSIVDENDNTFLKTKSLTQSEYDALTTKDASILYVITD